MEDSNFIIHTKTNGVVVIYFDGRLTIDSKSVVTSIIKTLVALRHTRIVISLLHVTYLNSDALGALISALKSIKEANGKIAIAEASEQAMKLFKTTMLVKVFSIHETIDSAIDEVAS